MIKKETLRYFSIYKPYGMLSQFSPEAGKTTLAELYNFPKDVYPVGRLDADSEGLLLLTNDKSLNHFLLNPDFAHSRTYLVQVDGTADEEALAKLISGVTITVSGVAYKTKPAAAKKTEPPLNLPDRNPPVRFRKLIPTSWMELTLTEGKNRQVRKMTAAVGLPTLRLIRTKIEEVTLGDMKPGDVQELQKNEFYKNLKIR